MAVRKLLVLPGGFLEHDKGVVIAGSSGTIVAPLPAYLIETDEGRILYDSGVDPDVVEDPKATWKGLLKLFRPNITPADHIVNRQKEIGLTPDDIDYVVQSHLHFDHEGAYGFSLGQRSWSTEMNIGLPIIPIPMPGEGIF